MGSGNMVSERPQPRKSEIHPPKRRYTPMVDILAVEDKVSDEEVDEEAAAEVDEETDT